MSESRGQVLIVDDEQPVRDMLATILRGEKYEVMLASSADEALGMLSEHLFDVLFTDYSMPGKNGLALLSFLKEKKLDTKGVMITAFPTLDNSVEALRQGAFDFLTKPFAVRDIIDTVNRAVDASRHRASVMADAPPQPRHVLRDADRKLIGKSASLRALQSLIEQVAPTPSTVLIRGESGTGKELVARALHRLSPRKNQPWIPVNCGAIPEELLESELFGHVKGSFTGAIHDRIGRFVLANKGTIFLDEIGDMSPKLQVKVLRILQEQELEPVGSTQTIHVDVRVIAATNVDLERAVEERRFREDLYYRLNVVPLEVPPLRERLDDLPLLIQHFIKLNVKRQGRVIEGVSPETMRLLEQCRWPGNVRELENLVERLCILSKGPVVTPDDLPPKYRNAASDAKTKPVFAQQPSAPSISHPAAPSTQGHEQAAASAEDGVSVEERLFFRGGGEVTQPVSVDGATPSWVPDVSAGVELDSLVDDFERRLILQALENTGGVKSRAAEILGIKRTTLVEKMKKKNIVF